MITRALILFFALQGVGGVGGFGGNGGMGGGMGAAPSTPSWDATSGTSCNPVFTSNLSSYTCTLTNITAGETILIGYFISANSALTSVTVDGVAATTLVNQALAGSFGYQGVFYVKNATAGSHTVAVNYSVPVAPIALFVRSVLGANATTPIDGTSNAAFTVGSGVAFSCGNLTTTATDLVVAWGMTSGATNITAGSGYTLYAGSALNSGNSGGAWESQVLSAGTYNPGFTNGAGGHQGCIGFGVKS